MVRPMDGMHRALFCKCFHWNLHHQREALIRHLSKAGKEPPGCGVEANRDGEQLVQKVHRSVLIYPDKSQTLKTQDRVNPGGEVNQEGVDSLARLPLCLQRSSVLPNGTEPERERFDKLFRKTAGSEHPPPPPQPRRPRGVWVNHDG